MGPFRELYRNYDIEVSNGGSWWKLTARPVTPYMPILQRGTSRNQGSPADAFAEAKRQIDRLLD